MPLNHPPFPTTGLQNTIDRWLAREAPTLHSDRWLVHGVSIELHTDHSTIRDSMRHLFHAFPSASAATHSVRIALTTHQQWSIPSEADILSPPNTDIIDLQEVYGLTGSIARLHDVSFFQLAPMGAVAYHAESGQALGYLNDVEELDVVGKWLVEHLFLQTLVLEMLRGRGLYGLHAGTVAEQGRAVLLVGYTRSGKTTSTLKLVEGGFNFLSEDRIFIRVLDNEVELLSFPLDVAVTAQTVELLPWLRDHIEELPTIYKAQIDPATLFPDAISNRATPGLILFPGVASQHRTEARPISGAAALQRILPQSLLAIQPDVSARHFEVLAQLVSQSRSYELLLGRDIERLPALVRDLLAQN